MQLLIKYQRLDFRITNSVFILISLVFCHRLFAQSNTVIPVETSKHALVLQTDKDKHPGIIYFGKKMSSGNDYGTIPLQYRQVEDNAGIYNSAYTPSGSWNLVEPAVRITHGDGNTFT
jgi:alpha-galactosidase